MTKKTLTLSIDNQVYQKLQKYKKKNPEFNISYRVEKMLIGIITNARTNLVSELNG
tara:strand:+ start:107 stop:274 length:168 start_codon:yes stop_codon:yes gene_type:complete